MKTIEERAESYTDGCPEYTLSETIVAEIAYIQGAKDQKKIDIEKACKWIEDNFVDNGSLCYRGILYDPKHIAEDLRKVMEENNNDTARI